MTWYTDSILGANRREALAKLPAELVALLRAESLTAENAAILAEKSTLPKELLDMVRQYLEAERQHVPMSVEEARQHQEKLMEERTAYVSQSEEEWINQTYNFCEP
jgi:hypothetical protein